MTGPPTLPTTNRTALQPGTGAPMIGRVPAGAGAAGAPGAKHDICGIALKSANEIGE